MKKVISWLVSLTLGTIAYAGLTAPAHADSAFSPATTSPAGALHNARAANRVFTTTDSIAAIHGAAARWGVDSGWLTRVATCESGLNPYAQGYGVDGLFQFVPGTYYTYATRIGETRSVWDPYGQADVAAYMFAHGLAYEWGCK